MNIFYKITFSIITFFIGYMNFDLIIRTVRYGFDETTFWFIPFILLLIFFGYFTFKIYTKKDFINRWKRTLETTSKGFIIFSIVIGLMLFSAHIRLSSISYNERGMPEERDYIYMLQMDFLLLLVTIIFIIMIGISFYMDFKQKNIKEVKKINL